MSRLIRTNTKPTVFKQLTDLKTGKSNSVPNRTWRFPSFNLHHCLLSFYSARARFCCGRCWGQSSEWDKTQDPWGDRHLARGCTNNYSITIMLWRNYTVTYWFIEWILYIHSWVEQEDKPCLDGWGKIHLGEVEGRAIKQGKRGPRKTLKVREGIGRAESQWGEQLSPYVTRHRNHSWAHQAEIQASVLETDAFQNVHVLRV